MVLTSPLRSAPMVPSLPNAVDHESS